MFTISTNRYRSPLPGWLEKADTVLKQRLLPLGLFIQLTGMLWIGSSGGYITQTYIWCLFPGLLSLLIDLHRYGLRSCIAGMTTGEKLLGLMFLWIQTHPLLVSAGMDLGTVFNRVIKIVLYLYVVRTVVLHTKKPERLLLFAAGMATCFAAFTMIYQFGVLHHPMGIRALGEYGYRVGVLGIGEFADLGNSILAALYYGCFATILCGYLTAKPFRWKRRIPAVIAVIILGVFILLSGSRGPLVAFIAMGGMALSLCKYSWKRPLIITLILAAAIVVLVLHEDILLQLNRVITDGFNCRFPIWQQAFQYIIAKPFLGYGAYANFEAVCRGSVFNHPHNMILLLSYSWGIIAALLYAVILVNCFMRAISKSLNSIELISILLLLFGFIGMLTDTYSFLVRPDLQWLLFFLPIAMMSGATRRKTI